MNRYDLLLAAAAACLVAAGALVAVPLGLLAAGVCLGVAWFLLGDA